MIKYLKDNLGIKEFNKMSCDTHVKRDSSEIGLSIPETFNNKQTVLEDKMNKEKNELIEMVREESAKRVISDGSTLKVISQTIISIGQTMEEGKATPREVEKLLEIKDGLDVIVDQFKNDVSSWASSFSFGEKEDK